MRKLIVFAAVLLLATSAQAQFLGQMSHARVQEQGSSLIGGYAGIYDDNAVSFFGQYRFGMASYLDGGFKLGFLDPGSGADAGIAVQGDLRYQILHQKLRDPLDLSLGGGAEFFFGDNFTVISFLFNGMGSYRFAQANGRGCSRHGPGIRAERRRGV
jgi:hypothetical protein